VELEKIKTLDISHNKLSSLPIILLKLKELEVLYVGHNRLSEVPLWFYRLHSVRKSCRNYRIQKVSSGISHAFFGRTKLSGLQTNDTTPTSRYFGRFFRKIGCRR